MIRTLQGFRDFIMRGNVIDLAVGIVIGAAFGSLVSTVTDKLLTPLIRAIGGGGDFAGTWTVNGQHVDWAAFINALIAFIITSAVLYFLVVLPMNRLAERRRKGETPPPAGPVRGGPAADPDPRCPARGRSGPASPRRRRRRPRDPHRRGRGRDRREAGDQGHPGAGHPDPDHPGPRQAILGTGHTATGRGCRRRLSNPVARTGIPLPHRAEPPTAPRPDASA